MTKEERKGKKIKKQAANQAGNKRGPRRPWKQLSVEEMRIRRQKKIKWDRDYLANIKEMCLELERMKKECKKREREILKGMTKQEPELTAHFIRPCGYFMVRLHVPYFLPSSNHATFLFGFYLIFFIYHF
ncbi:hypothetical protein SLEP1_g53061 [Rubroshorea leprosula]|uniref:Uncharacterized protein n=1 Tax=Rubroshorea leprosula TaxID=152421 RepID=A0AAV5M976_9ROSI|nr:hypothetical protein SLEP1_g53061 [Rubroshorea leprosula]